MLERDLLSSQFKSEIPFTTQTLAYQEGMSYLYSPDSYEITYEQFERMQACGKNFGNLLKSTFGEQVIEFRLDFVKDKLSNLFVTEVQTDDRGLPAIVNVRNSKGLQQADILPGTAELFAKAIRQKANSDTPSTVLIYPDSEYFYYAGFYDLARILAGIDPNNTFTVLSDNEIESINGQTIITKPLYNGARFVIKAELIWDFATVKTAEIERIQPLVDKTLLSDIWTNQDPLSLSLRSFIPEVTSTKDQRVSNNKNAWILKPANGRWSKGIIMGINSDQEAWEKTISQSDGLLAQNFIYQPKEEFKVIKKSGEFEIRNFYSRVEGYYIKVDNQWVLADILATCTPKLPIHGQRECIMIPGKIV